MGPLQGQGLHPRLVNCPSQVLQEKLEDGNLDPAELAIAAAAQVSPRWLPGPSF